MDSYVDAALRMQALCSAPSRTIVGNWVHELPAEGTPGPNLDELHEMVRFFDRWLRDSGAGAREDAPPDPPLTWFERDYAPPEPFPAAWPGRWRSAEAFPHPSVEPRSWAFAAGSLPLAGSARGRGPRRAVRGALPAPGNDGHPRLAVVGRRRLTQRPGARPAPGRGLRTGLHVGAARRTAVDPGLPGGRAPPGRVGPDRDRCRASCRRRARRDIGAGDGRHPEPHPPALACEPRAARARPRRGDPHPAARDGVSLRAGSPDPGLGRILGLAGRLAVAVPRRIRAARRGRHAHPD